MVIELSKKKIFFFLALLLVIIAVPITVYLSQKSQETRSRAAPVVTDSTVVATINGQNITKGDVRAVAEEQYEPTGVDAQALKDALEVLTERKVLDIEAQKKGISVDPSEIEAVVAREELSETQARYDILREKITLLNIRSRLALSIGLWAPVAADQANLDSEDKIAAQTQIKDGLKALPEIETRIKNGDDVATIAKDIIKKYPSLTEALAINGYKLVDLSEDEIKGISSPQIIEFGDSNMDSTAVNNLFSMNADEVKTISKTETNAVGGVYKIVEKGSDVGADTYDAWLNSQKSVLVVPKVSL